MPTETTSCQRCAIVDLVKNGFGETSPTEWAEKAMDRAMFKRTKRPHLLPHLAVTFAEAMQDAREDAARRIADAQ